MSKTMMFPEKNKGAFWLESWITKGGHGYENPWISIRDLWRFETEKNVTKSTSRVNQSNITEAKLGEGQTLKREGRLKPSFY